jgi:hypothetical protein
MASGAESARRWTRDAAPDVVTAALLALVLVPVAMFRFVDGDEGVYAYAGRLAVEGNVPYRDFFFEQTPLQPYVYGSWAWLTGESWYALRLLSALLAVVTGTLLFRHVRLRAGPSAAACALVLYSASGLALGYLTIVKTFPLAAVLLFGAYVLTAHESPRGQRLVAAGVLLGLAIDSRLLVAAAVPAFLVASVRARQVLAFVAGLAAGLVPVVVLLALDADAFVFDNLRYHALKDAGLVGDFHQKGQTAATLVGLEPTDRALGLQFLGLLVLCACVLAVGALRRQAALPLGVAGSVGVASLLPTPTYVQYFSLLLPFLVAAVAGLAGLARPWLRPALAVGLGAYVVAAGFAVHDFTRHEALLHPSISSVEKVAARVQEATAPGERVLSAWPGYLYGTHAYALGDYTNHFAPVAAAKVSAASAREFHVVSERELERRIRSRQPRLVVYRNWVTSPPFARWDAALRTGRYTLEATIETARIYRR